MDDPGGEDGGHPAGHRLGVPGGVGLGERAVPLVAVEPPAAAQLQRNLRQPVVRADVEDLHHVRVFELVDGLRLRHEPQ